MGTIKKTFSYPLSDMGEMFDAVGEFLKPFGWTVYVRNYTGLMYVIYHNSDFGVYMKIGQRNTTVRHQLSLELSASEDMTNVVPVLSSIYIDLAPLASTPIYTMQLIIMSDSDSVLINFNSYNQLDLNKASCIFTTPRTGEKYIFTERGDITRARRAVEGIIIQEGFLQSLSVDLIAPPGHAYLTDVDIIEGQMLSDKNFDSFCGYISDGNIHQYNTYIINGQRYFCINTIRRVLFKC